MAVLGDKVYNSCLPLGEPHQKLLAAVLILLGFFALLDNAIKLTTWVSRSTAAPGNVSLLIGMGGLERIPHKSDFCPDS